MTLAEAKQVQASLARNGGKTKLFREDKNGDVWRVELPFTCHDGAPFRFYCFKRNRGKKIYLSDGGALLKSIHGFGQPQMHALQQLVGEYGLKMMEDFAVLDDSDRALSVRVMSFLQAWCSVDGVIRIWKIKQEEVINALRSSSRQRQADESLRSGSEDEARAA